MSKAAKLRWLLSLKLLECESDNGIIKYFCSYVYIFADIIFSIGHQLINFENRNILDTDLAFSLLKFLNKTRVVCELEVALKIWSSVPNEWTNDKRALLITTDMHGFSCEFLINWLYRVETALWYFICTQVKDPPLSLL